MRIALVLAAGMIAALMSPAHAAPIECGAVLGPGGKYTLDRDLVCQGTLPLDDYGFRGALNVSRGATLNLKGHTVSCLPSPPGTPPPAGDHLGPRALGIRVIQGTLKNGTVRGCDVGVSAAHGAVVKRVVAEGNDTGFEVLDRNDWCCAGTGNAFRSNTATNNRSGFWLRGVYDSLVVDNVTMGNGTGIGFDLNESGNTLLLRNVAIRHYHGFVDHSGANQIIENRSIDNREDGFILGEYTSSNVVANVAKRNGKAGFNIFNAYGSTLLANVAHRNGRFGFMIHVDDCPDCFGDGVITSPVRLSNNVATRNQYGIALSAPDDMAPTSPDPVWTSIWRNAATQNEFYDVLDENSDCRRTSWSNNTFRTVFGPCIAD